MRTFIGSAVLLAAGAIAGYALAGESLLEQYLPLTAAAEYHRAILENDTVRVLDVRIPSGDTVPAHQHNLPSIFITLSPADLVFRNLSGETVGSVRRTREPTPDPEVGWFDPSSEPRIVSNIDTVEFHALRIELKRAGG